MAKILAHMRAWKEPAGGEVRALPDHAENN
jgi:hypothetical protein